MANCHLSPCCAPVNDIATPTIVPPADLLRRLLRMMRAALIVEHSGDYLSATPSRHAHWKFQHMHHDVYAALHDAVAALSEAECSACFRSIGKNISAFFLAECTETQTVLAAEITAAFATHAQGSDETAELCGHIRREFDELKRYHRVLSDPLMNPGEPSL